MFKKLFLTYNFMSKPKYVLYQPVRKEKKNSQNFATHIIEQKESFQEI